MRYAVCAGGRKLPEPWLPTSPAIFGASGCRTTVNRSAVLDGEVHALLRAAGASSHGLARRNYALVQLMVQTGLRVGEVAALQIADLTVHDRSGSVHVRHWPYAA